MNQQRGVDVIDEVLTTRKDIRVFQGKIQVYIYYKTKMVNKVLEVKISSQSVIEVCEG